METLQNIWNFIGHFYTQNTNEIFIWSCIFFILGIITFIYKIIEFKSIKENDNKIIEAFEKQVSILENLYELNIKEINRLSAIISNYNSKFVEFESDNLPKRNHKTGRFEKRL